MWIKIRKCLCYILCLCLCFSNASYAATPSTNAPSGYPPKQAAGKGTNPTLSGDHGGVRITVTNMQQAEEYGIGKLDSAAPYTEVAAQHAKFASLLKSKIWEPGKRGLFIVDDDRSAGGIIDPTIMTTGGSGYKPTAGIFRDYGFRVTITTNQPIKDAGISVLNGNYSMDDVINHLEK